MRKSWLIDPLNEYTQAQKSLLKKLLQDFFFFFFHFLEITKNFLRNINLYLIFVELLHLIFCSQDLHEKQIG